MIAVVTGGCSGLGLCFSKYLASIGYKVYALYNSSVDNALELESEYDNIRCIKCDIRNELEVENTFFNIDNIDLLINNAAISKDNDYKNKTKKEFMSVLETNLVGTFLVIKNAIDKLNKNGIIINISSNNALSAYKPYSIDYDASKAGVNMLTLDFGSVVDNSKKVISICPGWINTDSINNMNQAYLKECLKEDKQSKLIEPDDLVKYIISNLDKFNNKDIIEIKEL